MSLPAWGPAACMLTRSTRLSSKGRLPHAVAAPLPRRSVLALAGARAKGSRPSVGRRAEEACLTLSEHGGLSANKLVH